MRRANISPACYCCNAEPTVPVVVMKSNDFPLDDLLIICKHKNSRGGVNCHKQPITKLQSLSMADEVGAVRAKSHGVTLLVPVSSAVNTTRDVYWNDLLCRHIKS